MQHIIQVNQLTKSYSSLKAVDNLSFAVKEGDVYGFLGQNGAGKSTTIRILLTLIKPTSGSIKIFGYDLANYKKDILKNIGAVIERPDLYRYLSAWENLKLFSKLSGIHVSHQKIKEQLAQVGLADRANDKVKTFSQGMKQRLGIAIALVHDPSLIILDEPTNGLDPQGIADVRNLILHLSKDLKKTIVVSSHLLHEIEQIATRVLIIDKGQKIIEAAATELFDLSQTVVEIETLDNNRAYELLHTSYFENDLMIKNNKLSLQLHKNDIPSLTQWLVNNKVSIVSLRPRHKLEDYFLQVTSESQYVDTFTN